MGLPELLAQAAQLSEKRKRLLNSLTIVDSEILETNEQIRLARLKEKSVPAPTLPAQRATAKGRKHLLTLNSDSASLDEKCRAFKALSVLPSDHRVLVVGTDDAWLSAVATFGHTLSQQNEGENPAEEASNGAWRCVGTGLVELLRSSPEAHQSLLLYTSENLMRTNAALRTVVAQAGGVELITARLYSTNGQTRADAALCLPTLLADHEGRRTKAAAAGAVAALLNMNAAGEECFPALSSVLASEATSNQVALEPETASQLVRLIANETTRSLPMATRALSALPNGRRFLLSQSALVAVLRQISCLLAVAGSQKDLQALLIAVARVAADAPIHVVDSIKEAGGLIPLLGLLSDPALRPPLLEILRAWVVTEVEAGFQGGELNESHVAELVAMLGPESETSVVVGVVSVLLGLVEWERGTEALQCAGAMEALVELLGHRDETVVEASVGLLMALTAHGGAEELRVHLSGSEEPERSGSVCETIVNEESTLQEPQSAVLAELRQESSIETQSPLAELRQESNIETQSSLPAKSPQALHNETEEADEEEEDREGEKEDPLTQSRAEFVSVLAAIQAASASPGRLSRSKGDNSEPGVFEKWDTNSDGVIDRGEFQRRIDAFQQGRSPSTSTAPSPGAKDGVLRAFSRSPTSPTTGVGNISPQKRPITPRRVECWTRQARNALQGLEGEKCGMLDYDPILISKPTPLKSRPSPNIEPTVLLSSRHMELNKGMNDLSPSVGHSSLSPSPSSRSAAGDGHTRDGSAEPHNGQSTVHKPNGLPRRRSAA